MTQLLVIGLDPGESFGVRTFFFADRQLHHTVLMQTSMLLAVRTLLTQLEYGVNVRAPTLVACERYVGSARLLHQRRTVGAVHAAELLADLHGAAYVAQRPADAKQFAPAGRLKALGLYARGADVGCRDANDANDATRHALLALATRHTSLYDELVVSRSAGMTG